MFVGSTATKALSNMAEVVSRSSTRANLASVSHASKHLLSTSRKVHRGQALPVFKTRSWLRSGSQNSVLGTEFGRLVVENAG